MVLKKIVLAVASLLAALSAFSQSTQAQPAADIIVGNWLPSEGGAIIQIYKGAAEGEDPSKYYGKIIWLEEPIDEQGNPKIDLENPDALLRTRPIKGLVILKDLEFTGDEDDLEWENGRIYDPSKGSTYNFKVEIDEEDLNTLEGRGFIGVSLFGRTDTWRRTNRKMD